MALLHIKNTRIVMSAHGGPEVLNPIEEDIPDPRPGEVHVKILATGVAFADLPMRYGLHPNTPPVPFSLGYEIVGTIDRSGQVSPGPALGDTVAALTVWGGYVQFINLRATELTPVPAGLDPAEAGSLVLNYVHRIAELQPGQSVLIHGTGGGVGTAALQLGKLAGLDMYATASRAKHDVVTALGGKPINYGNEDFVSRILQMTNGQGVEAVLDPVGGSNGWRSYKLLRMNRGNPACKLIGDGSSAAIVNGKPSKLTGAASFALPRLLNFLPDGKHEFRKETPPRVVPRRPCTSVPAAAGEANPPASLRTPSPARSTESARPDRTCPTPRKNRAVLPGLADKERCVPVLDRTGECARPHVEHVVATYVKRWFKPP